MYSSLLAMLALALSPHAAAESTFFYLKPAKFPPQTASQPHQNQSPAQILRHGHHQRRRNIQHTQRLT